MSDKAAGMMEEGAEDTAIAKNDQAYGGYSQEPEFDSEDTFLPRLRLGQSLSQEVSDGNAKSGEWLLLGNDPVADVTFVPVAMARKHQMRDGERQIVRHNAAGEIGEGPADGNCGGGCPYSTWTKEEDPATGKTKNIPPKCEFFYSYIGFSITHGVPVSIDFRKTAIPTGKTLNTFVQQRGMGTFAVVFEGKEASNKRGGKYFVPKVSLAPESDDNKAGIAQAAESLSL